MADRIMRAVALIEAHDKTGKAFASAAAKVEGLAKTMKTVEKSTAAMNAAMLKTADVSTLARARQELVRVGTEFRNAQDKAQRFAAALKSGAGGGLMAEQYRLAQGEVRRLAGAYDEARMAARRAATDFKAAGAAAKSARAGSAAWVTPLSSEQLRAGQRRPSAGRAAAAGGAAVAVGGGGIGMGGLVGGYAAYSAYSRALNFEREINAAEARGELTKEQSNRLRRESRAIGAEGIGFTGQQLAKLGREYVQAGYETSAPGLIRPTARFAVAGDVEAGKAADFTGSALAAYGIKSKNEAEAVAAARKYQDIIARGANISRLGVEDFASGFKYAAPMAAKLNVSMEQLAAMIATQGQAGLRGDEAGVAIRSMLVRAVKPTQDARQAMAELGLRFEDYQTGRRDIVPSDLISGLKQRGIDASSMKDRIAGIVKKSDADGTDVAEALSAGLIDGLGIKKTLAKDKISKMVNRYVASLGEGVDIERLLKDLTDKGVTAGQTARIFDAKQGSRLSTLLGDSFNEFLKDLQTKAPGSVDRAADRMTQGAVGAHNRLVGSLDNLVLSLAESGVLDSVSKGLDGLASGLRVVGDMNPKLLEFATYAGMAAVALGPITMALRGVAALGGLGTAGAAGTGGAATSALGTALGAGGVMGRLPLMSRLGAVGMGAYAGIKAGEFAHEVGSIAAGKYWTPKTADDTAELKDQLSTINGKIDAALARVHPSRRDEPNPVVDQLKAQAADLTNRISQGPIEATVKPDQITAKADVKGEATVTHTFTLNFNAGAFQQFLDGRIASQVSKIRLHSNGPGSTGVSSPDAQ